MPLTYFPRNERVNDATDVDVDVSVFERGRGTTGMAGEYLGWNWGAYYSPMRVKMPSKTRRKTPLQVKPT